MKTVYRGGEGEIVEKKSRFICNMMHVESEQQALDFIKEIKKKYYDARHNVYAYIIGDGSIKKCSDDGEPSKTAGIPILQMLEGEGITDVVCVVTRYFGGTLLGTGGLVRAYTLSAKTGLKQSGVKKLHNADLFMITLPYSALGSMEYICTVHNAAIEDKVYTQDVALTVSVLSEKSQGFVKDINEKLGNGFKIELIENTMR